MKVPGGSPIKPDSECPKAELHTLKIGQLEGLLVDTITAYQHRKKQLVRLAQLQQLFKQRYKVNSMPDEIALRRVWSAHAVFV